MPGRSPNLRSVLDMLHNLSELDQNLSDFEDAFNSKFAAAPKLDVEVTNQTDALVKAQKGIEAAREAKKQAEIILGLYPDDKTAQRAAQAADVMLRRFERHVEAARKIIRRIAKKEMPAALKKAVAATKRGIQRVLVDPKELQVIPWVAPSPLRDVVADFLVYLVVPVGNRQKGIVLRESISGKGYDKGVAWGTVTELRSPYVPNKYNSPKEVVSAFTDHLRGWSGIKGEADKNTARNWAREKIRSVLLKWARHTGFDSDPRVEEDNSGMTLYIGFRTDTRWESYSEWEYDMRVPEEAEKYEKDLKWALGPDLMKYVKKLGVSYAEKGWWYVSITLK